MKISQAIKLGHRNIVGYKRRNFTTIIIVGVMFGFLMGIIFLTQGVENAVRQAADEALGDEYYVSIQTNFYNDDKCYEEPIVDRPNAFDIICEKADIEGLTQKVAALNGEVIALSETRILTLSPEVAQPFLQYDLNEVADTAVPVLQSSKMVLYNLLGDRMYRMKDAEIAGLIRDGTVAGMLGKSYQVNHYDLDTTLTTVGILPTGGIGWLSDGMSLNPLDFILDFVGRGSEMSGGDVVIDNGSTGTKEYLDVANSYAAIAENAIEAVLKFDSFDGAKTFADENTCPVYGISMGCKKDYFLESRFDNRIMLARTGKMVWWGLGIAEIVVAVFAIIITLFTFVKVMHGEAKTIALYRSLGASLGDVAMIYLMYMLEVCLLAVGFAVLLGLAMALIISFTNMSAVAGMLTVAYGKVVDWPIILVGWNFDIAKIAIVVLLVAPVALALNMNTLRKR